MTEDEMPWMDGKSERRRPIPTSGTQDRSVAARDFAVERGTQLAAMNAKQFSHGPGSPGAWSRFLLAHLRWILIVTLVVVGGAVGYVRHQTPQYHAQAAVNVWFASAVPTALQGPNMVTEKGIVSSAAVLRIASRILDVPQWMLLKGLSVSVPAGSSIMNVAYSDPVPWVAQERAQVIAESYVAYRVPSAVAKHGTNAGTQTSSSLRATLITPAALPTRPSSPKTLLDILAALILGLGVAIGTAALRDHLDDRFRGPLDVEERTGVPVLALVPAFRVLSRDPAAELVLLRSPDSVVAEAYRSLRTRVLTAVAGSGAKTLVVTSPGWEKKGTVAANLAVALAQSGRRTILVCADLRWGSSHEPFGVRNDHGLSTVLDAPAGLATALHRTRVRNLWLLPPGPRPADPAAFLQRPALRTVMSELRGQAAFVVIDAPPLLANPDFHPLVRLAETVLLVGDARRSTRAHLQAALREAGDAVEAVIGCVLYNVGRHRWLRSFPEPVPAPIPERAPDHAPEPPAAPVDRPLDIDRWSPPAAPGGHEAVPTQPHSADGSLPAANSWRPSQHQ